ncbi:MAG: hypothetical protein JO104_04770 [Candidatus Eremiobacteraeota bacterium]|nr:hypothetical protein [Candidatus Eremiobacteraeota bacterium]
MNNRSYLSLSIVCASLAACATPQGTPLALSPPLNAQAAHASTASGRTGSVVFTCQNGTVFDCLFYTDRGRLLRKRSKHVLSPLGVAAGKDGLLYVANEFGDDVLVYSAGGHSLLRKLRNGGNVPIDVAVFNDELAVSNQHALTVFRPGAKRPTRTLHDPNVLQGSGAAFDPNGNCYWSYASQSGKAKIDEFAGCKGKPITLNVTPGSPYGIAFDRSGNLYYTSFSSQAPGVYRCSGTSSCRLIFSQFVDPEYLNFSHDFKDLWINDPGNISVGGALDEIDIATGKVIEEITGNLSFFNPPSGVAAAPGSF